MLMHRQLGAFHAAEMASCTIPASSATKDGGLRPLIINGYGARPIKTEHISYARRWRRGRYTLRAATCAPTSRAVKRAAAVPARRIGAAAVDHDEMVLSAKKCR